jgi:hypothetical protein
MTVNLRQPHPFPLEDSWADLLIKRLALEAARKGHRAIEVASPQAIKAKVGGDVDNYEHFYGKVVPGALDRLGRKMGGLHEEIPAALSKPAENYYDAINEHARRGSRNFRDAVGALAEAANKHTSLRDIEDPIDAFTDYSRLVEGLNARGPDQADMASYRLVNRNKIPRAEKIYEELAKIRARESTPLGYEADLARAKQELAPMMPQIMRMAETHAADSLAQEKMSKLHNSAVNRPQPQLAGKRYIMSDEMRRRLIEQGVGAAVGGVTIDGLIDRLGSE